LANKNQNKESLPYGEIVNDGITLYNGDCLEVMDYLISQNIKVDAIITDPPYGTTRCKWDSVIPFDEMWERLNKLIKPNGAIVLFGSEPFSSALRMSNIKNYKYDWYWDKGQGTGFLNSRKMPLKNIELISVFQKVINYNPQMRQGHKPYKCKQGSIGVNYDFEHSKQVITKNNGDRYPLTLIKFVRDKEKLHPTQKPVALIEYLIKTYTNENELILDFTAGSFTTGVACQNTKRKFIGIELDKDYFEIGLNRMKTNKTGE
jgi:site-specific DNA-methyltransferase (adenine-specific)